VDSPKTVDDLLEAVAEVLFISFVIGLVLITISFLVVVFARDFVYGFHGKFYPAMTKQQFDCILYALTGAAKMFVFTVLLAPYIGIRVVLKRRKAGA